MNNLLIATVALAAAFVSCNAFAGGVPVNPITQKPGNSTAAQDVIPGGQANCLGDLISTARQTNRGDVHPGPDQHLTPATVGAIFLLGSVIGPIPLDECEDQFQP